MSISYICGIKRKFQITKVQVSQLTHSVDNGRNLLESLAIRTKKILGQDFYGKSVNIFSFLIIFVLIGKRKKWHSNVDRLPFLTW